MATNRPNNTSEPMDTSTDKSAKKRSRDEERTELQSPTKKAKPTDVKQQAPTIVSAIPETFKTKLKSMCIHLLIDGDVESVTREIDTISSLFHKGLGIDEDSLNLSLSSLEHLTEDWIKERIFDPSQKEIIEKNIIGPIRNKLTNWRKSTSHSNSSGSADRKIESFLVSPDVLIDLINSSIIKGDLILAAQTLISANINNTNEVITACFQKLSKTIDAGTLEYLRDEFTNTYNLALRIPVPPTVVPAPVKTSGRDSPPRDSKDAKSDSINTTGLQSNSHFRPASPASQNAGASLQNTGLQPLSPPEKTSNNNQGTTSKKGSK